MPTRIVIGFYDKIGTIVEGGAIKAILPVSGDAIGDVSDYSIPDGETLAVAIPEETEYYIVGNPNFVYLRCKAAVTGSTTLADGEGELLYQNSGQPFKITTPLNVVLLVRVDATQ